MLSRTVGNGPANFSKPYQPSTPMPDKWNPERFQPFAGNPEKVRPTNLKPEMFGPQELTKSNPQKTLTYAQPQARLSPPTRLPSPPSKRVPAQVLGHSIDAATTLPPMHTSSLPITQQSLVPGSLPGPSTLNNLRSPRSVSVLAGACQWTSRGENRR
jgi:hypothetical protein